MAKKRKKKRSKKIKTKDIDLIASILNLITALFGFLMWLLDKGD